MDRLNDTKFYLDCFVVSSLFKETQLQKTAENQIISGLTNKIKELVQEHVNPDDKIGSLINILSPGIIFNILPGGFVKKFIIFLLLNVFHINVGDIIESIWDKLKNAASGDKQIPSSEIDNAVQSAIQEHDTSEETSSLPKFQSLNQDIRIFKLSILEYQMIKSAARSNYDLYTRKKNSFKILSSLLGWIFKVAFASAGLLIAGDIVNNFLGRNTKSTDKTTQETPTITSKQTKFPVKATYSPENNNSNSQWVESISNNEPSIENMLVQFAKDVYSGLDGKEDLIRSSPAFNILKDRIVWYNHTSPNAPMVFIPRNFKSKKEMVDYFIDSIANKTN